MVEVARREASHDFNYKGRSPHVKRVASLSDAMSYLRRNCKLSTWTSFLFVFLVTGWISTQWTLYGSGPLGPYFILMSTMHLDFLSLRFEACQLKKKKRHLDQLWIPSIYGYTILSKGCDRIEKEILLNFFIICFTENESKEGLWVMVAMRARKDIHIPEVKLLIPV